MPVLLEQHETFRLIRLEGEIDVSCATELKEHLMQELKPGAAVRVSLESNTDLDITAVQLLWAARRNAERVSAEFTLIGHAPQRVRTVLAGGGIREF